MGTNRSPQRIQNEIIAALSDGQPRTLGELVLELRKPQRAVFYMLAAAKALGLTRTLEGRYVLSSKGIEWSISGSDLDSELADLFDFVHTCEQGWTLPISRRTS